MAWQSTPHVAVLLASAVVCAVLVSYAVWYTHRYHLDRTVVAFGVLMAGMAMYSFTRGIQLGQTARADKLLWARVLYLGFAPGVAAWVVFTVEYNATEPRLRRRSLYALGAYALLTAIAGLTNPWHELLWSVDPAETVVTGGALLTLDRSFKPAFFLLILLAYGLFMMGLFAVLRTAIGDKTLFRDQALAIGIGAVIPVVTALPYLFGVSPGGVDFTPASYGVAGVAYAYAIFRHRMLDVRPVARNTVISSMRDGFVVLDRRGRIVDYNAAATTFLDAEQLLGTQLTDVLSVSDADLPFSDTERPGRTEQTLADIDFPADGEGYREMASSEFPRVAKQVGVFRTDAGRSIEVEHSPLVRNGRQTGQLVMFRDITERTKREQMRQRKNERLERFAGIVSHDLRNPLNVASLHLDLAREETDSEHLDSIGSSLDRMETIIEDTLALARQGQTVTEPEPVDVTALAARSWAGVETGGGSLATEESFWVEADPERLQQVFENLFRNALEHGISDDTVESQANGTAEQGTATGPEKRANGDDSITVRVGRSPQGFYVEDNGVGIDPGIRDELFEPGASSDEKGTGFGLAITSDIVTAHGWEIAVTDSASGGARFEITNVQFADPESVSDDRERVGPS